MERLFVGGPRDFACVQEKKPCLTAPKVFSLPVLLSGFPLSCSLLGPASVLTEASSMEVITVPSLENVRTRLTSSCLPMNRYRRNGSVGMEHPEGITCSDLGQTSDHDGPNDSTSTLSSLVVHVLSRHKPMDVFGTRRDDLYRMPDAFGIWACVRGL